jgi:energy-coupling factor transporter ATP-binding protein EcfA2
MQERVAIARARTHDPKLILMDEPFGALDALTRERMNLEMGRIWRASRKTIIFVTHSIQEAVFLGTHCAVLTARQDCGAPRWALPPSGWLRSPTSRCERSPINICIGCIGITRMSQQLRSPRRFVRLRRRRWRASCSNAPARRLPGTTGARSGNHSARRSSRGGWPTTVIPARKPDMHAGFGLPLAPFRHTEFPHYYRAHAPGETEREFSARMAQTLDMLIQQEGPDTIAAFFAEPVMGAGGAIVPPQGYFEQIQAVLHKYDVLFVADEVICGFARMGEMWGSTTYDIRPDMITLAKALSAAMQPISAVLVNDRIHDAMLKQSGKFGNFVHG